MHAGASAGITLRVDGQKGTILKASRESPVRLQLLVSLVCVAAACKQRQHSWLHSPSLQREQCCQGTICQNAQLAAD